MTLIVRVEGMPWLQTGTIHYHTQSGVPEKGFAIKGLVVCYVVWDWSLDKCKVRCLVPCCGQDG